MVSRDDANPGAGADARAPTRAQELRAFLALSVVLAPVLAGIIVTGYGFLVWMVQLVAGPPGSNF
jgi:periplasmic nitrate reductase NapE